MVSSHLIPLIIAGPTGSGKSALALKLALKYRGEIICADSRQYYQHMRIGTASPSDEEMALVPHHGFNIVDPAAQKIDAGFFINFAQNAIASCQRRGKRPILVGGTGLYLRCLRFGLSDVPKADQTMVLALEQECNSQGLQHMYEQLSKLDRASASVIEANDRYRILRALAIYRQTGALPSALRTSFNKREPLLKAHLLFKTGDQESYLLDLKKRVHNMVHQGLIEEAIALKNHLGFDSWALKVMGYEEALAHVDGVLSFDEMLERIFIRHRQYAKRQRTWFRREGFSWQIK